MSTAKFLYVWEGQYGFYLMAHGNKEGKGGVIQVLGVFAAMVWPRAPLNTYLSTYLRRYIEGGTRS